MAAELRDEDAQDFIALGGIILPDVAEQLLARDDAVSVDRQVVQELELGRCERQPVPSVDDLRRVSGIGPKTLDKLRAFVTVGGPPTDMP